MCVGRLDKKGVRILKVKIYSKSEKVKVKGKVWVGLWVYIESDYVNIVWVIMMGMNERIICIFIVIGRGEGGIYFLWGGGGWRSGVEVKLVKL